LLKLLYSASTAAGALCTALLLVARAIARACGSALVLHEEPQFAVKTDAGWCTPVSLHNKSGAYYCTAGLSKAGQMLLIHLNIVMLMSCSSSCICTAAVKSLHPNICIAVHCSIPLHPRLPWYHESAHHWELRDQV